MIKGFFALLVLIADIWAILNIFQSSESNGSKVLWIALVIVFPVIGFIVWYVAGPKGRSG